MVFAECGGYLSGAEGVITSPHYPDNYPSAADCLWRIKVGLGKTIRLEFDEFKVTNTTPTCGGDYLVVSSVLSVLRVLIRGMGSRCRFVSVMLYLYKKIKGEMCMLDGSNIERDQE